MGEILRLPVVVAAGWPEGLVDLQAAGFRVLALTPAPDAVDLDMLSVGGDERVALLLGAEGPGLTAVAQATADVRVRIPITAGVDSLNVGHAAAVALHRVAATRRQEGT
jgi:tRNA G18 (ribose-2'-O)-methylase SpoU